MYSELGVVNLALSRLGVKALTSADWASPATVPAIKAAAVWEYILDEVLTEKDWVFAKTRAALGSGEEIDSDVSNWDYAYQLPTDFLRLAKPTRTDTKGDDPCVYPYGYDYKVETVVLDTGDILCLLIDYNNSGEDLSIVYIKRQTDPKMWSPGFVNALAWRLANELCVTLTEHEGKVQYTEAKYHMALVKADEQNSVPDYLQDELGNNDWEYAGRGGT